MAGDAPGRSRSPRHAVTACPVVPVSFNNRTFFACLAAPYGDDADCHHWTHTNDPKSLTEHHMTLWGEQFASLCADAHGEGLVSLPQNLLDGEPAGAEVQQLLQSAQQAQHSTDEEERAVAAAVQRASSLKAGAASSSSMLRLN